MAVSLTEAWNDPPEFQILKSNPVSARTSLRGKEIEPEEKTNKKEEFLLSIMEVQKMMLFELQESRKDEARRCMVYLSVAGILFAMLFIYIDRLHNQMKSLNLQYHRLPEAAPNMLNTQYRGQFPWQM